MQVIISSFAELGKNEFLDPRTAQVAIIDHVKQVNFALLKLAYIANEDRDMLRERENKRKFS